MTTGAFWNGDRLGLTGGLSWKVNQHLSVSHSQGVDYVQLATGRFTAHIWRLRFAYSHDTRLSLEGLAQYANDTRVLGTQLRLRYIVAEGTELYLVANEQFAELAGAATSFPGRRAQEALAVKATYRSRCKHAFPAVNRQSISSMAARATRHALKIPARVSTLPSARVVHL